MLAMRIIIIIGITLIAVLPSVIVDSDHEWDPLNFNTPFVKIGSK